MADFRRSAEARYDGVARFLHWSIVALIMIQFVIGWTMPDGHHDTKPVGLIAWHLGVGATLVAAMALRIIWRLTHRPPPRRVVAYLECRFPDHPSASLRRAGCRAGAGMGQRIFTRLVRGFVRRRAIPQLDPHRFRVRT